MIEEVEKVNKLVIGKYYLVNTVTRCDDGATIPIHGPLHEDAEIINFPHRHWHIDWRFIGNDLYRDYKAVGGGGLLMMPWAWPINEAFSMEDVTRRKMKCKRQFGPYVPVDQIPWLKRLENKFHNSRMKNFICPHRGLPCNATPVVDGVVVCRGHGLAFNVNTGDLVSQFVTEGKE